MDVLVWHWSDWVDETRPVGAKAAKRLGFHDIRNHAWEPFADKQRLTRRGGRPHVEQPCVRR